MATPTYATDLVDIQTDSAITNWTALGGGASGLAQETDYFIQGTSCVSKSAWTATTTPKGMIYNNGSGVTVATGSAVWIWLTHLTPNSLDTMANGGLRCHIGSSATAYYHYYVGGNDTLRYDQRWLCVPVDPRTGVVSPDSTTGSPTSTLQYFGGTAVLPTTAPSKGAPFAVDAIRYGRAFTCTNGQSGAYASFGGNGSDAGAAAYNDATTRTWGQFQYSGGTYRMQGLFNMGSVGTAVFFVDADRVIFISDTPKVASTFNGFEVNNSSSTVSWTGISITALGTTSRGYFLVNAGSSIDLDSCSFSDMDTFGFSSNTTVSSSTFKQCGLVTQTSATISTCTFDNSRSSASVLSNNPSLITDCTFISDGSNHALELTSACAGNSYNLTGHTFTNYAAADGSTGNETIYNNSGGAVTLNAAGNSGNLSIRNGSGASTTIVADPVTTTITVKDLSTGLAIEGAKVVVWVTDSSNYFYQATVSITGSGTTATVSHTSHGLVSGDYVIIEGVTNDDDYNGVYAVTVTGANSYTYTTSETLGASPATGTIKATLALISGNTNASGVISDSRSLTSNQTVSGWVRKSSAAPYYQQGAISGTINSSTGLSVTVQLARDE